MCKKMKSKISAVLLFIYTSFLLYITLLGRSHFSNPLGYIWSGWLPFQNPFTKQWNFDAVGNIVMFIPFIFLLLSCFSRISDKNPLIRSLLISFLFSLFIETTQLVISIGTFQIADLVYNTVSGGMGYVVYKYVFISNHSIHHDQWNIRKLRIDSTA